MQNNKSYLIAFATVVTLVIGCVHQTSNLGVNSDSGETREPASVKQKNQLRISALRREIIKSTHRLAYGQRAVNTDPTPAPTPFPMLYKDENVAAIHDCILATCGPAERNWNASSVLHRPGTNLTPSALWNKSLRPKIRLLLEREKQNDIAIFSRIDKLVQDRVVIQPGQPLQALISFMQILKPMTDHLADVIQYNPTLQQVTLNRTALEELLETLPAPQRIAAGLIAEKILYPMATAAPIKSDAFENSLTKRLRSKYANRPLKEAQQLDATYLGDQAHRIRKILGNLVGSSIADDQMITLFDKAKSGQDLSKSESARYMEIVSSIELFGSIYDDGPMFTALMSVPTDVNQILKGLRESSFSSKKLYEALNRDMDDRMRFLDNYCSTYMQYAFDLNTSPLRLRRAADMAESVKLAAMQMLSRNPLADNNDEVIDAVSRIQFALPDSNTELTASLKAVVRSVASNVDRGEAIMSTPGPETDQLLLEFAALAGGDLEKTDPEDMGDATTIKKACEALPVGTVSDHTLTAQGKIAISWFTAAYPSVGVSIFAHEVGHVVSAKLRSLQVEGKNAPNFSEILSCVANRNPFVLNPVTLNKFNNTPWSEEDWADHFSSMLMNDMTATNNKWSSNVNQSCAYVNNDGVAYSDSTPQPAADDPHSSAILRLLFVGVDRKSLPRECQSLLSYAPANGRKLKCE